MWFLFSLAIKVFNSNEYITLSFVYACLYLDITRLIHPLLCVWALHLRRVATNVFYWNYLYISHLVATRRVCNSACVCGSRAVAAGAAAGGARAHPALRTPLLWISGTPSSIRYERATPDWPLYFHIHYLYNPNQFLLAFLWLSNFKHSRHIMIIT